MSSSGILQGQLALVWPDLGLSPRGLPWDPGRQDAGDEVPRGRWVSCRLHQAAAASSAAAAQTLRGVALKGHVTHHTLHVTRHWS